VVLVAAKCLAALAKGLRNAFKNYALSVSMDSFLYAVNIFVVCI
jgi:hypothetical protein